MFYVFYVNGNPFSILHFFFRNSPPDFSYRPCVRNQFPTPRSKEKMAEDLIVVDFTDDVLVALNAARSGSEKKELHNVLGEPVNAEAHKRAFTYAITVEDGADEAATKVAAVESLRTYLADESNAESDGYKLALAPRATHCEASINDEGLNIVYQFKYLELPAQGPAIDGVLVVQGNVLDAAYAPVLCTATFEGEDGAVVNLGPWDLMFESAGEADADDAQVSGTFTVPVPGLPEKDGSVRVQVYVGKNDDALTALFAAAGTEEADAFMGAENLALVADAANDTIDGAYVCALDFTVESKVGGDAAAESSATAEVPDVAGSARAPITAIKLAMDFDEVSALRSSGFDLTCSRIGADGYPADDEGAWPFYIMHCSEVGASPVISVDFVTVPKVIPEGAEEGKEGSSLPAGFEEIDGNAVETFIGCDLAAEDSPDSIFLRVTTQGGDHAEGTPVSGASFNQLAMLVFGQSDAEGNAEEKGDTEETMDGYVSKVDANDKVFVAMPDAIAARLGVSSKNCGVLLSHVGADTTAPTEEEAIDDPVEAGEDVDVNATNAEDMSHMTGSDAGDDDEDFEVNEALLADQLEAKLEELAHERATADQENAELQKKAIALMVREKAALQGNNSKISKDITSEEDTEAANERIAEKEKILHETLQGIVASRAKISQQTSDYDQLAHDLQTRLDDREYKANEIYESFAAFKSEILGKAENTRTSKPLSKRLIKQFEVAQSRREEDLERVRLRNISMRTQLLRLERQLRNKEQLAEGLHMIDFEQLKVENQTLYEKIEERTEELTKLNRKKTNTVQVLTHVREKLRFIEKTNVKLNGDLSVVENQTMGKRGTLTSGKKGRDSVREDNKELKRKQGFASSSGLLTDYEKRTRNLGDATAKLMELKAKYDMLATQCAKDEEFVLSIKNGRSNRTSINPTPLQTPGVPGTGLSGIPGMGDMATAYPGAELQPTTPYFPGAKPDTADSMPFPPQL